MRPMKSRGNTLSNHAILGSAQADAISGPADPVERYVTDVANGAQGAARLRRSTAIWGATAVEL